MRYIITTITAIILILSLFSCDDLDRKPLAGASPGNWYADENQLLMSINDLYRDEFWPLDSEEWTDDYTYRETNSAIVNGTLAGQQDYVTGLWNRQFKAIARANIILARMDEGLSFSLSKEKEEQYKGECLFMRASMYSRLISHFGDVPYLENAISIDEAFAMGRTPKEDIIPKVYADFDEAVQFLPKSYPTSATQRATRGAALALKARFALYNGDWDVAAKAAKECLELDVYELEEDFSNIFLATTKNSKESIFVIPRSIEAGIYDGDVHNYISRNPGGWAAKDPSWDLLAVFLCTDGLPIDESPLFNPQDVFKNRDPRCTATIVEFGSRHLGYIYDPHPEVLEVMNFNTGLNVKNQDTRAVNQYASFNALIWKKGIDETYLENGFKVDPDKIIVRLADVMLMYAEAKIELGQIDASVLEAINTVRARAYGVDHTATTEYPAIDSKDQNKLRQILRIERRMELAKEGQRYMDLIRWRLAEKALSIKSYGILYPAQDLIDKVTSKGLWFWASTPQIDEDGIPDFTVMEKAGQITVLSQRSWNNRQYLWPIPTKDILINDNLKQNPGY